MRERTTWNREAIAKFAAALNKKAEDPRAMNQDHLKEQPSADKYVIGGPSEFGEDVHPSTGTWKAEYSGGEVKRDEIGMAEMRKDTFNHPEKTAADQQSDEEEEAFLEKKADVCLNIARRMLPKTASESVIEDQAVALMHLPNTALIETATRLAADEEAEEEGQAKQAQDQAQDDKAQDKQAQQGQLPDFIKKKKEEAEEEKKQAGEVPPQFLEHMKKKEDGDDKGQDKQAQDQAQDDKGQDKQAQDQAQEDKGQDKQAQQDQAKDEEGQAKQAQDFQMLSQQMAQAFQQGNMQMAQQMIQQMVQQAMQQAPAQQAPAAPMASDDQLLDQMLQQDPVLASASPTSLDGFDLQGSAMDVGEVKMASEEDEALRALFASHTEVQEAAKAHSLQGGVRTASTRTVGTRPSGGVSQLGGSVSDSSGGSDVEKLSSLWQSAPDVKNAF